MSSPADRVSTFFEGARRRSVEIVSPEGVPLTLEVGSYGDRLTAFALDFLFWSLASTFLVILVILLTGHFFGSVAISIAVLAGFLIRNLYLIHFELAWRGATPGKRIIGLRVIDRHGGPLLPGAVIARNLTREIEFFIPLGLLSAAGVLYGGSPWQILTLGLWMLLFTLLPLFNRERLRAGDMIAGTMVVALPRRLLLDDLAEQKAKFAFAEGQLKAYGAFELQVLEELLRRGKGPQVPELRREVADKICRKIGWTVPLQEADVEQFLRDFYAAERAYLEREQLYGRPKASKDS
jgi:uncharacterized RDD family membrane protein YckC